MILYGPPGTGKTTLARLVAATARAAFEELSAVEAGRAEVRKVLERAAHRRKATGEPTIFFLDEIHRFNKAQQDTLLPAVEEGLVTLIGATTENPYFEVNGALLSRSQVYELKSLDADDVEILLRRALDRGELDGASADEEAIAFLADRAGGDARTALAALELAAATAPGGRVTIAAAEDALQRHAVRYDKGGDQHYDLISAWIKSARASDPDAALYYLAVMLEGGEDPRFIVRRMIIFASEDVGNADPQALSVATAAAAAVQHVGLPECEFALSQATIYLALAPKSKAAAKSIWAARAHVRDHGAAGPPPWLRSARLRRRREARARRGLRRPALAPRPPVQAGRHAGGGLGNALLHARRAGGEAARTPRADPSTARTRTRTTLNCGFRQGRGGRAANILPAGDPIFAPLGLQRLPR